MKVLNILTDFIWRYRKWFLLSILVFTFIFRLGEHVVHPWDEARNAVNAQEMFHNNNFLVTHFEDVPDMWNTKPPLLFWLQVVAMYLFGENEWSLRLPSALAAIGICLVVVSFFRKYLDDELGGYIAALVLVSTKAFTLIHGARRAEFDVVLIFFQVLTLLKLFEYFKTGKVVKLYLFSFFLALAVLTKSIVGFMLLPGFFIYVVFDKEYRRIFKNVHLYLCLVLSILLVLSYYFTREYFNQGYLEAVYLNELGGRYLSVLEENKGYFLSYLHGLTWRHLLWVFFVSLGVVSANTQKGRAKEFVNLISIVVICYFLIISVSKTQLVWYDLPIYPFLAMIIAVFFSKPFAGVSNKNKILLFCCVFCFNYAFVVKQVVSNHPTYPRPQFTFSVAEYIREELKKDVRGKEIKVLNTDFQSVNVNRFYLNKFKRAGNMAEYVSVENLKVGDTVIVCYRKRLDTLKMKFETNLISKFKDCDILVLQ